MPLRPRTALLATIALTMTLALSTGCKQRQQQSEDRGQQDSPSISPRANPGAPPPSGEQGSKVAPSASDWRNPDAGVGLRNKPLPVGKAASPAADAASGDGSGPEDPEQAKQRALAEAKKKAEKAVDQALGQVQGSLKACYEKAGIREPRSTSIRFRVHRSGYLMTPDVDEANSAVKTCITAALGRVRVSNLKADSFTVSRTLRFGTTPR